MHKIQLCLVEIKKKELYFLYTNGKVGRYSNSKDNEATSAIKEENDIIKRENNKLLIELDRLIKTSRITNERMLQVNL